MTDGGLGEANNLKIRDLELFEDDLGRRNYRFKVKGKTGERDVILRASAAKSVDCLLTRGIGVKPDDWLFVMGNDNRVITLIDQFDKVLNLASITHNSHGDKYTLYSLRHFYAVLSLRRGIGVFDVARNMETSVQVIQSYYGKARHVDKVSDAVGWVMAWYGGSGRRGTSRSGVGRKAENLYEGVRF